MAQERKIPKRIQIIVTLEEHLEIKKRALFKNTTITKWIKIAIGDKIKEEESYE